MNEPEWHEHPCYWKMLSDERSYAARSECKGFFCGWTALALSVIIFSPLVWFCIDCYLKAQ